MKFLSFVTSIIIFSCTLHAMELPQQAQHGRPPLWADPEEVTHGFYLAEVTNKKNIPIRISNVDFNLVADEELKVEIEDENNISPVIVVAGKGAIASNKLPLKLKIDQQDEVTCLKVEHLMDPKISRFLAIARTFNKYRCDVKTFIDSQETHEHSIKFVNFLHYPKVITRVFITIKDEKLNDLKVATSTFSCS